jgi:hypothetical protein
VKSPASNTLLALLQYLLEERRILLARVTELQAGQTRLVEENRALRVSLMRKL